MSNSAPAPTYSNAVVLYHWHKCGHCVRFMPVWEQVKAELLRDGVGVWDIEVEQNKSRLEELGVDLGGGVPRLVFYAGDGAEAVFGGTRSRDAVLAAARAHLGVAGGVEEYAPVAGGGAELETVTPEYVSDNLPVTVLYFRHNCGYCVRFLPTFTEFAGLPDVGVVVGVDTSQHPSAMGALQPDASSAGVPHVVHHGADGTQTAFNADRTVAALRKFVKTLGSPTRGVSFEGGSTRPVMGSVDTRLATALDDLQDQARRILGEKHDRAFEPDHAFVQFVGARGGDTPASDRVFILVTPIQQPRGKPTAHAAVYGSRTGPLMVKIYAAKNMDTLLRNKQSAGFAPVLETDLHVQTLQTFGYTVGLTQEIDSQE